MRASSRHHPGLHRGQTLLVLIALSLALLIGCESSPTRQHEGNPFDPNSDTGGDALQLQAITSLNQINLLWTAPTGMDISEYFVYVSDSKEGTYDQLAIVPVADGGTYTYDYPTPNMTFWFKVQAFTADGNFSVTSFAVPASATLGPTVVIGDTVSNLATRFPELTVTATFGDSLIIGLNEAYTNAWRVAQAGVGVPTVFNLDLGPAAADSTFTLYVKAAGPAGESISTIVELPVKFNPIHSLVDATAGRLATRVNDLAIPGLGVIRMRFAPSEAELASAPWLPGADLYPAYELADSANPQEIWGEYEGDFGFTTTAKLTVRPDLLRSATFQLNLPSNRIVSTPIVTAQLSGAATQMRVSENPDFSVVPWQTFRDTINFQLSAGEGNKTVYCQYRNDWTQSAILSDYCIFLSQGLSVNIFAPVEGNVIPGGANFIVRGNADPGTVAAAIDSVKLDLGDGQGFREVIGTAIWQLNWVVPTFEEDTELVLRARAWADSFMVTDVVTVTVSQLTLRILEPLPGATVVGGDPLVIAGDAFGLMNGTPLDSVTVDIGSEHLPANGTDSWSVTWPTPVVTVSTPTDITATVWAGGESFARMVTVTLMP